MRVHGNFLRIVRVIFLVCLIDLSFTAGWFFSVLDRMPAQSRNDCPDVVVILMGNFNHAYTGLGDQTLRRLNFVLRMNEIKPFDRILCVGGNRRKIRKFGAEYMKAYLLKAGIPEDRVLTENVSYNTRTNWQNAIPIIRSRQWPAVAVVSSAIHLKRFSYILRKYPIKGVKVVLAPFPYFSVEPKISVWQIWQRVHYEWVAYVAGRLPSRVYQSLMKVMRRQ